MEELSYEKAVFGDSGFLQFAARFTVVVAGDGSGLHDNFGWTDTAQ
jgi:hypothetical protein